MKVGDIPYRHGGLPGRDRQDNTIPEAGWERRVNVSHGTRILNCIAEKKLDQVDCDGKARRHVPVKGACHKLEESRPGTIGAPVWKWIPSSVT